MCLCKEKMSGTQSQNRERRLWANHNTGTLFVPEPTGFLNQKSLGRKIANAFLSPTGTKIIAQGKAEGRNPGYNGHHHTDPEGIEQWRVMLLPFRERMVRKTSPEVTLAPLTHPRLLSLSPSATGNLMLRGFVVNQIAQERVWRLFLEEPHDIANRQSDIS